MIKEQQEELWEELGQQDSIVGLRKFSPKGSEVPTWIGVGTKSSMEDCELLLPIRLSQ
jgi:hypothetical protein